MAKRNKTTRGENFGPTEEEKPDIPEPSVNGSPKKRRKGRSKHGSTEPLFPPIGLIQYTLLEIDDRAPLPDIPNVGRPSVLIQIVTETPDLYKKLITLIRLGACGHVAAERLGISEKTFYEWASIGRQELQEDPPPDTYYTRFYTDVRRAIAMKRSEIEIEMAAVNQAKWLSHGPGRIFGDNWSDKPQQLPPPDPSNESLTDPHRLPPGNDNVKSLPSSKTSSNSASSASPPQTDAGSGVLTDQDNQDIIEGSYNVIDENTSMDALEELQREGVIEVSRSYKAQINKQTKPDD